MAEGRQIDDGLLVDREPRVLVGLRERGIRTRNYYWDRRESFDLSEETLAEVGVTGEDILVRPAVVDALHQVNQELRNSGFELLIKEGYRAPELYRLIGAKWRERWGTIHTERLLNLEKMPHATGLVVDASVVDVVTGEEVWMRNADHDLEGGQFVGFYRDHSDPNAERYEALQSLLIDAMTRAGFRLGEKGEFWHFELGDISQAELLNPSVIG